MEEDEGEQVRVNRKGQRRREFERQQIEKRVNTKSSKTANAGIELKCVIKDYFTPLLNV